MCEFQLEVKVHVCGAFSRLSYSSMLLLQQQQRQQTRCSNILILHSQHRRSHASNAQLFNLKLHLRHIVLQVQVNDALRAQEIHAAAISAIVPIISCCKWQEDGIRIS